MNENTLPFAHRFVPAQTAGAPTLLLLHGTGGSENDLLSLGQTLCPGAALLSPRGPVLENGMSRFFRRLSEGVFDEEDLRARTHQLADFVAAAARAYSFDATRVVGVGYSNGANIAASTLLLRPETLSGAVLLRAMVPLEPETVPDLRGVPVLLASGRLDAMVPVANAERLATLLREAGANVTVHWQSTGHGLESPEILTAQSWLAQMRQTMAQGADKPLGVGYAKNQE